MRQFLTAFCLFTAVALSAQTQKEDGTWWDNNLQFEIKTDILKAQGRLEICIYDSSRDLCIENLVTGYEIRIYDASNKELWNSLWTGKNMDMKFSKKFPNAQYIIIKATRPFVINILTGTRIYQDKALELKYTLQ